jgi:F-type H+-transporting ATPase subunit b
MIGDILNDPTFWVGVGLAIFVIVVVRMKVPGMVAAQLDARSAAIRNELDQAQRLRAEAQGILRQYEAKRGEAEVEAQAIIAAARVDAERIGKEAEAQLHAHIERRAKAAEQKIAHAESAAIAEVRAAAASAAIAAAEQLLKAQMTDAKADALADAAIKELGSQLH